MRKLLWSLAVFICAVSAFAHDDDERYRSWNDHVNTRELSVQTVGMVVILLVLVVIRYRTRRTS